MRPLSSTHFNDDILNFDLETIVAEKARVNRFVDLVALYQFQISRRGLTTSGFNPESIPLFLALSPEKQQTLCINLKNLVKVFSQLEASEINPLDVDLKIEIQSLDFFLKKLGFKVSNPYFFKSLDKDDLIELYDLNGLQIYRSWSTFKYCSYSVDELMTYDWNTLFERPSHVVEYLMSIVPEILSPENKIVTYNLGEYLIRERFPGHDISFFYKMKNACSVLSEETGEPIGFLTTATARMFKTEPTKSNVHFV